MKVGGKWRSSVVRKKCSSEEGGRDKDEEELLARGGLHRVDVLHIISVKAFTLGL